MGDELTARGPDPLTDLIDAKYSTYLVSYIDVLGFADRVEQSRKHPAEVAKIASLLSAIKVATSAEERIRRDASGKPVFVAFNFSDLTVRATRIPNGEPVSVISLREIFYLAELQLSLALDGYLVRGGVCIGELYIREKDSIVFGPGLVKAHTLESEYAIYPRIVVDRDLVTAIKREGSVLRWRDYIRRGEDGAHYIDYLHGRSVTGLEKSVPSAGPSNRIRAHGDMIKEVIADNIKEKGERIKQKYIWLAQYHNEAVRRLPSEMKERISGGLDTLVIPEELLDF